MGIDWVTTIAQIVNFLVLMALLKVFLFKPVVRAMDEREAKVRARLAEADAMQTRARQEEEAFRRKNRELERLREEQLERVKMETDSLKKEWTRTARDEVERVKAQWTEALRQDRERFLADLRHRVCQETCAVARGALKELAGLDLEQHVLEVFSHRLRELPPEEKATWGDSLGRAGNRLAVRSAFEISGRDREKLAALLEEQFSRKVHLDFQRSPEMVLGVELQAHDRKLAWNLEHYLDGLEDRIQQALPVK